MPAPQTPFVHEFQNNLVGKYTALAAVHGLNTYPVSMYEGRHCYVTGSYRVKPKGRHAYNVVTVWFCDDGSVQQIPAGKFNKAVKDAPLRCACGMEIRHCVRREGGCVENGN